MCGFVPSSGRYASSASSAIIFSASSGSMKYVAMASVGQLCVQRVVCGAQLGSSIRWAQPVHFWATSFSSFQQMAP